GVGGGAADAHGDGGAAVARHEAAARHAVAAHAGGAARHAERAPAGAGGRVAAGAPEHAAAAAGPGAPSPEWDVRLTTDVCEREQSDRAERADTLDRRNVPHGVLLVGPASRSVMEWMAGRSFLYERPRSIPDRG